MAVGEPAPEPVGEEPAEVVGTQLSADGNWWWDGERWVSALSPDGLWRWDGTAWQLAADVDTEDPAALAEDLDRLVDARFAEAGHVLALRAHEWRARDPELAELVQRAAPLAARLAALDSQLAGREPGRGLFNLRQLLAGDDGSHLEAEARAVEAELRPLAALIGRMAPQPSLKEADDLIASARRLSERVVELSRLVADVRRLTAGQETSVAAARERLQRARAERAEAMRGLEEQVQAREQERMRALEDLAQALRQVRMPQPGNVLARFGNAILFENRVDTPDGRGPLEGAVARVAAAGEIWAAERPLVNALGLLEATHAARFQDALVDGAGDQRFLLIRTPHASSLLPVPEEQEAAAREFADQLTRAARGARRRRAEWEAREAAAEAALQAALDDRSAIVEATAALEAASADPELNRPVTEAEAELSRVSAPPAELVAARRGMDSMAARLLEPPAPPA